MYRHILVPIDASELSVQTVSKAVAFAKDAGARITFFTSRPDFGATESGAVMRTVSPEKFADQAAGNARAILSMAETEARDHGVPFQSIATTSDRPYQVIVDTAEECGCDLIFMSSHGRRGLKNFFLGSQTERVLTHTHIPVLVSVVEKNTESPEMDLALSIVLGEHRSMRAVLFGIKHVLRQAAETGKPADLGLLRAMTHYFRAFRLALHHPKEEEYLLHQLVARSPECRKVVEHLESQHDELTASLKELEGAFHGYESSQDEAHLEQFIRAVDAYEKLQWVHIRMEEKIFMTECRRHLTVGDWKNIAREFKKNPNPKFDKHKEAGFEALFARIMNMAEKFERAHKEHAKS